MRVLGLDLGEARIGVAVSDSDEVLATAYGVVPRGGGTTAAHRRIAELVEEVGAGKVVVGLPLSLDGRAGPAAEATLAEVEVLRGRLPVPVETHDERLTTVSATRNLRRVGAKRPRRVVDQVAASVMLQSWLDGARR